MRHLQLKTDGESPARCLARLAVRPLCFLESGQRQKMLDTKPIEAGAIV
jgi:hypothetical protein